MKSKFTSLLTIVFVLLGTCLFAQFEKPKPPADLPAQDVDMSNVKLKRKIKPALPAAETTIFDQAPFNFQTKAPLQKIAKGVKGLRVKRDPNNALPIWIEGTPEIESMGASTTENTCREYLTAVKALLQIDNPSEEFQIVSANTDVTGRKHIRLQQYYQGVKVQNAEILLHTENGQVNLFNGRYFPTPSIVGMTPVVDEATAMNLVKEAVSLHTNFKDLSDFENQLLPAEQLEATLVIYHLGSRIDEAHLAWHVTACPNLVSRYEYFVDAQNGDILHHYNNICQIHGGRCDAHPTGHEAPDVSTFAENGFLNSNNTITDKSISPPPPTTANATDLSGVNRTINVYETGGTFFMIDASRNMFNSSSSSFPNDPIGVVWTIDGNDNSPQNNNFEASHVTSSNNNWNSPTSVSAHYNGGVAYEYFRQTFNRNSINGQGGNIVSLINITETNGADMDNAFWNGQAMFYGNGNQAFSSPLAKALDVAGHEMAHGVIQGTANLTYQNESGALNESFADIFGAMIDRDDWKIGEDVANGSVFPSGTMRDMQNPNNGGNSLNDHYYQPDHYDERYTGSQDNGGVHINSGIPNHAYYLFATNSSVGKSSAEQIFYKVLKDYLVASSKFIDLRNAVVEVAGNDFGQSIADIAANAFEQVGIGEGPGTNTQNDAGTNPGDDFILWSDLDLSNINNVTTDGTPDGSFTDRDHISKPSVSDNGTYIDFVAEDNNIWEVIVDWSNGSIVSENTLSDIGTWRNVAISKDGQRIAAVNTSFDNTIWVYDFNLDDSQTFELYNPTFTQGVTTGDVDYADFLEFDITGEYIMYDAQSTIDSDFGDDISYWDIGFIRVWNDQIDNFGDGEIQKLFSGLPENVSVGNPTFSKNSPYIIAFDYIENTSSGTEYAVIGMNIETYYQSVIWENDRLGYPNYSIDDNRLVFTGTSTDGNSVVAVQNMGADKISPSGDPSILVDQATWGVWYATGERDLTIATYEAGEMEGSLQVRPNPFAGDLYLDFTSLKNTIGEVTVFDMVGKPYFSKTVDLQTGNNEFILPLSKLTVGTYLVQLKTEDGILTKKLVKEMR
ncbi:MAG: M4 family metallopeptidase [Saprospiraceae bacterium]